MHRTLHTFARCCTFGIIILAPASNSGSVMAIIVISHETYRVHEHSQFFQKRILIEWGAIQQAANIKCICKSKSIEIFEYSEHSRNARNTWLLVDYICSIVR